MKPKVAFFDFACCEGCQLQIVDLEEQLLDLLNIVDLVEFREAISDKGPEYDISFIEGSITREQDEARIKDIRNRSKILVAFGACATTGGVNKLKNLWSSLDDVRKEVYKEDWKQEHLDTYPTKAVDEVVKVDYYIHGCPINKDEFLSIVKSLAIGKEPKLPVYPVCVECKMKENVCLFDKGQVCLGPIALAGCGAMCPSNGSACEACRGTMPNPNKNAMHEVLKENGLTVDDIKEKFTIFAVKPEVSK